MPAAIAVLLPIVALGAAPLALGAAPGPATTGTAGPAAEPLPLHVEVAGLGPGGTLPVRAAYCPPVPADPSTYNISPAVTWTPGPAGTRSYVLIMTDLDVPRDLGLVNKPGYTIPADIPRVPFVHWVLIDIPPSITALPEGADSDGFILKGRSPGPTDHGLRGANVYTYFYPKDSGLAGIRGGYDGPCPPHNDAIAHRYVTRVYALDVASLGLRGDFFGEDAARAMRGHVLASGEALARYGSPP